MFINNKFLRCQQQRIKKCAEKTDSYQFFNLLTCPELLSRIDTLLPEHRERLYPPTETLSIFLAQALSEDRSCQKAVNDAAIKRIIGGLAPVSTSTGGYCRARQRLPLAMVSDLVCQTGELINCQIPEQWRWHGRRVHLIDGTTVTMPDTVENQAVYPQQSGQKPGLGFPICRLVGVICLSSGAVLNASIGRFNGKGSDEQSLLRNIIDTFDTGDLVLGDAFYGTYFLLASLREKGIDAVFEQMGARKRVTDFRKGKRIGTRDHLIELTKPKIKPDWMTQAHYDVAPKTLLIRELSTHGKILITTLLCPKEASKPELKVLYKKRWQIEVDFRNIKTTMGMETLSCKTPEMSEKEIWVYFLAYNLIRLLMAQTALLVDILPRQLSFKHTLQLWLAWTQQTALTGTGVIEESLFVLIAQQRVGNRSGRIEPRAVKRRPKPFSLLMKPREEARAVIRKNGHPKKIK
ncbi:transposase [Methyloprofundus sedimenti]|uniref:Transposase n=1 Tax=Methyloprofundus sedimenti TaxID=1420851 RepID=A0A1V8M1Y6_9GAMM|nr:IS4 family transposase [Methyloprofundus sedimenti]OQK15117.1 transposase [Methyloprofundus sedimenti]OQK15399.1 transposase [Methyloprofundus sedimenti]OQK15571.1 transposase [Methyloprofundus sedimenti]